MRRWKRRAPAEQGRGFAVVAGEVTSASRSAQAAKEIKVLIDESVSRVKHGSVLVENSGATMQDIVRSVTRVTDIMGGSRRLRMNRAAASSR